MRRISFLGERTFNWEEKIAESALGPGKVKDSKKK